MSQQFWEVSAGGIRWRLATALSDGPDDKDEPDIWRTAMLTNGKQVGVKFWRPIAENASTQNYLVEESVRLATMAHVGQVDKTGQPYILHVLRVGAAGRDWKTQVVGFLHDVLEDTSMSESTLRRVFGDEIMIALDSVTRAPGEVYSAYVARANRNEIGRAVKIADLRDNLGRLSRLVPNEETLRGRYQSALVQLGVEII